MIKSENIQDILQQLKLQEPVGFEFNEDAILDEYQKSSADQSSLAIKVLSIFGGLLATLAFMAFLLIAGLYDSGTGLLIFGFAFIIGAIGLNKAYNKIIIDTLSISVFTVGFILIGLGLDKFHANDNLPALLFILIAICSLIITQNYILSFISILIVNGCILSLIFINKNYNSIHIYNAAMVIAFTYVLLNEAKFFTLNKKISKLYNPLRIGLLFSLLMGLIMIGKKGIVELSPNLIWLSSVATVLAVLYVISILLPIVNANSQKDKVLIYTTSLLLLLLSSLSPAISGSLLIILLGFFVNYKTGFAIGILSFIYFIAQYYYDLQFSLLLKSGLLFSSGLLFMFFYLFTKQKLSSNEKI